MHTPAARVHELYHITCKRGLRRAYLIDTSPQWKSFNLILNFKRILVFRNNTADSAIVGTAGATKTAKHRLLRRDVLLFGPGALLNMDDLVGF